MGPLFSIAVVLLVGLVVLGAAFCVARIFNPTLVALLAAFAFVVGGGVGTTLFGLVSWFIVGTTTFPSHWQVISYLAMLGASAISSGLCLALVFLRILQRSNRPVRDFPSIPAT